MRLSGAARRRRARGPVAGSLALVAALLAACSPAAPRPNVVLVTIDTLRADELGAYGAPPDVTPRLDALAREGVVFERALAASSRTAPSHASLFTSRWVRDHSIGHRNGATRLAEETTLAALLSSAGYTTAAFVSNTMLRRRVGLDRGFATYDDDLPDREANRDFFERHAPRTTRAALDWLALEAEDPFFLWVQYNDPHGPYTPPASHRRAPVVPADEDPLPALPGQRGIGGIPAYQVQGDLRHPAEYRALYTGEIRFVDEWFGRLLDAVDARAGAEATIVVVVADHGETLGEEGFWFSHGYATTPNLAHVPWLIRAPGITPARIPDPVHHVDLVPTLLELVGLPPLPDSSGVALGPVMRDEAALPERTLFVDVGLEVAAYRGDRFLRIRSGEDLAHVRAGTPLTYRWNPDGSWGPTEEPLPLEEQIRTYDTNRAALLEAASLSDTDVRRLRALGYIEPGSNQLDDADAAGVESTR